MKKCIALLISLFSLSCPSYAQKKDSISDVRHSISLEAFGQGFFGSINYEHSWQKSQKCRNSFSIGAVYVPKIIGFGNGEYLTLPSTYSWQFGRKWHHLELGLGFTQMMIHPYYFYSRYEFYTYASQKIAYRFQSPKGGLFVRLSFLSMIDLLNVHVYTSAGPYSIQISSFRNVAGLDQPVFFWPGACLGFTFKK